jgi:glycosyltransferase involved in cell wall biosynthesis
MRIVLITTYKHGGAGVACRRLQEALTEAGHQADLITRDDFGFNWQFYAERLSFLRFEADASVRFSFSLANYGKDISRHPLVLQADVIHLHWINQGLLSLTNLHRLASLGKKIVWTLHDMWAFTGGCHYSRGCHHYQQACGDCLYLKHKDPNDLSHHIWKNKKHYYPTDIQYVTCSKWLRNIAQSSTLLAKKSVVAIPNPISAKVFHPAEAHEVAAQKQKLGISPKSLLLLFVAVKIKEERKGFTYFKQALEHVKADYPQLPIEVLLLGNAEQEAYSSLPYSVHSLGFISDAEQLALSYSIADVFIIPSLEDNLPNTVMESLACGTPVVGFDTGGIPEMVIHGHTGYIAPQKNAKKLAEGIYELLFDVKKLAEYKCNAVKYVQDHFSQSKVAAQYLEVYTNNE